jgi:aminodeoxyfutalosine deaminase
MNSLLQTETPRSLRARWVFPVSDPPLQDAAVTIADGRIVAVGNPAIDVMLEDLGNVALLPGLINAHTHLEFSDIAKPIGNPDMDFVGWLRAVMESRNGRAGNAASAIAQGIAESLRHGVTTIAEIAQPGCPADAYAASPCELTLFLELIAPRKDRVAKTLQAACEHLEKGVRTVSLENSSDPFSPCFSPGLCPHAPYTVHPELLVRAAMLSSDYHVPLAMHLAESLEELEFLTDGAGPLRDLLESRGGYDPAARHCGSRPLDELRCMLQAHRALVIHGNYLDDEEIEFLSWHRHRMAVVYCPRTHAWFDHAPYPLRKMLAAGVVVALGTDSRASSPDLSVLAEMRRVARAFPMLSRATILELGTLNGAQALGRETEIGTLELDNWANLTAIRLPDDPRDDPHDMLIDGEGEVVGTWMHGRRV